MKVIDLLNKIANGEEVPKIIKYNDTEYEEDYAYMLYEILGEIRESQLKCALNDEVEVVEDIPKEDKKIEKLEDSYDLYSPNSGYCTKWTITETILKDKINEIIDRLNGDSDE